MPDQDTSNEVDSAAPAEQPSPQPAQQQSAPAASESQAKTASTSGAGAAGAPHSEQNAQPAAASVASAKQKTEGEPSPSAEAKPAAAVASEPQGEPQQASDGAAQQTAESAQRPSVGSRPSAARKATRQPTKRKKVRRWPRIVALVLLIAVVSVVSLAAWQYWLRFDDAADVQGTWVMQGSTAPISITDKDIVLSPDVSYGYSIDTGAKTLTYSFGNLSGSGAYHFADDRNTIVIREHGAVDLAVALGLEDDPALLATDNLENGIIVLHRVS